MKCVLASSFACVVLCTHVAAATPLETEEAESRSWRSRYGVLVMPSPEGSAFYANGPRVGMWTSFEYRIPLKYEVLYWGVAVQLAYDFSSRAPFGEGLNTELIVWEPLARMNLGAHLFRSRATGAFLYGIVGGGGQYVRGRAWSTGDPVVEATGANWVFTLGGGSAVSFLDNRLEVSLEGGYKWAPELLIQHRGPAALLLPSVTLSALFMQIGVGLAF